MPPVGKITWKKIGADLIVSDQSGRSFTLEGYGSGHGLPLDVDPRIDLTLPIYEQVQRSEAKRAAKKSRHPGTAA